MNTQPHAGLIWRQSLGALECYEARITTTWSEYIGGVVIAQESERPESGYTAYVEYFKHGVARQLWGGRIFENCDQAKIWCEGEVARLRRA